MIPVWFYDSSGSVFEMTEMPAVPRVGDCICCQYWTLPVLRVEWSGSSKVGWTALVHLDTTGCELFEQEHKAKRRWLKDKLLNG